MDVGPTVMALIMILVLAFYRIPQRLRASAQLFWIVYRTRQMTRQLSAWQLAYREAYVLISRECRGQELLTRRTQLNEIDDQVRERYYSEQLRLSELFLQARESLEKKTPFG